MDRLISVEYYCKKIYGILTGVNTGARACVRAVLQDGAATRITGTFLLNVHPRSLGRVASLKERQRHLSLRLEDIGVEHGGYCEGLNSGRGKRQQNNPSLKRAFRKSECFQRSDTRQKARRLDTGNRAAFILFG
jgi:hypothetical protein